MACTTSGTWPCRSGRRSTPFAGEAGVKVAIERHPHNFVFNLITLEGLVQRTGATNVGAELDLSYLMWQGMDIMAVIRYLGPLVFHGAAKDAKLFDGVKLRGVPDDGFTRVLALRQVWAVDADVRRAFANAHRPSRCFPAGGTATSSGSGPARTATSSSAWASRARWST